MRKIFFSFFTLIVWQIFAQLPETDIWLFRLKKDKENISVERGDNVSNRSGYDNQPCFTADGSKIYFVSVREDKQADIYGYSPGSKKSWRVTSTKESEYSPTLNETETHLHCVTLLQDSSQIIVPFELKDGKVLTDPYANWSNFSISRFDSVGYFAFLNQDTVLYYKLTSPHTLRAHCISSGHDVKIAAHPVRSFKKINRSDFIFGVRDSSRVNFFIYKSQLQKAEPYCSYPSLSEDFIWHKEWGLMKSEKTEILRYDVSQQKWMTVFNLANFGITKITRFSFDPKNKMLLLVDNK